MSPFLQRSPRLHVKGLPGSAAELDSDEFVWTHLMAGRANGRPEKVHQLLTTLCRLTATVRRRPALNRPFLAAADLPAFL